jgi:hypothetical protein
MITVLMQNDIFLKENFFSCRIIRKYIHFERKTNLGIIINRVLETKYLLLIIIRILVYCSNFYGEIKKITIHTMSDFTLIILRVLKSDLLSGESH